MKFVIDESVELSVARALRATGHEVVHIAELAPGEPDTWVLALSVSEKAILVTADKDFGDLVYRDRLPAIGILLLRLADVRSTRKAALVVDCIALGADQLRDSFTVLTSRHTRSRPLKAP